MKKIDRLKSYFENVILDNKILIILMFILGLVRVLLELGLPSYAIGYNEYDDMLMLKYADYISSGNWLGPYGKTTLLKRPSFSLLIAFFMWLNIPYKIGIIMLYILSVAIFIIAVKPVIKTKLYLFIIYSILLFSPAMLNFDYVQRIYRMAIVPSAVLLVVGSLIGMYFRRKANNSTMLKWSILTGISLCFFWNIREDSIWMLPFILGAVCITLISLFNIYKNNKKTLVYKSLIVALSLMILTVGNNFIKLMNLRYYGIYTSSDLADTNFNKLMETFYSIKQDEEKPYINVNRSTIDKLCGVSPTLNSLKKEIDEIYEGWWQEYGKFSNDGEIEGVYIRWAFRDVVEKAGYYKDAKETDVLYEKIDEEIHDAINKGYIELKDTMSLPGLTSPWKEYYSQLFFPQIIETFDWIIDYDKINTSIRKSEGSEDQLRYVETITRAHVIYPDKHKFRLNGWIFPINENDNLKISIKYQNGEEKFINSNESSIDVYNHFVNNTLEYSNAKNCRFNFEEYYDSTSRYLCVYLNGTLQEEIDLLNFDKIEYNKDLFFMFIDNASVSNDIDPLFNRFDKNVKISNNIINIYQKSGNTMMILGTISYMILTAFIIFNIKKKNYRYCDVWLVLTGVIVSLIILIVGVSYTYIEAHNTLGRNLYLAGAYPLLHIFTTISIITLLKEIIIKIKEN